MLEEQLLRNLLRNKDEDEKRIIHYFNSTQTGCITKTPMCTEEEFDSILSKRINSTNLVKVAIQKNAVEPEEVNEIEPVVLKGFEFFNDPSKVQLLSKMGIDGKIRSTIFSVTVILFSKQQIYIYKRVFSLINKFQTESTEEYFYKDITNLSQSTTTIETVKSYYQNGCLNGEIKEERLTKDGKGFSIIVPGDKFKCSISEVENSDDIIKKMKMKLREMKG